MVEEEYQNFHQKLVEYRLNHGMYMPQSVTSMLDYFAKYCEELEKLDTISAHKIISLGKKYCEEKLKELSSTGSAWMEDFSLTWDMINVATYQEKKVRVISVAEGDNGAEYFIKVEGKSKGEWVPSQDVSQISSLLTKQFDSLDHPLNYLKNERDQAYFMNVVLGFQSPLFGDLITHHDPGKWDALKKWWDLQHFLHESAKDYIDRKSKERIDSGDTKTKRVMQFSRGFIRKLLEGDYTTNDQVISALTKIEKKYKPPVGKNSDFFRPNNTPYANRVYLALSTIFSLKYEDETIDWTVIRDAYNNIGMGISKTFKEKKAWEKF